MKRRLVKIVLFLALGAIINIAVAWGCANWVEVDWEMARRPGGHDHFAGWELPPDVFNADRLWGYTVHRYQQFGTQRVFSHTWNYSGAPGETTTGLNDIIPQWALGFFDIPELNEGGSSGPPYYDEVFTHDSIVDGRGWPFLSLWGGMKLRKSGFTNYDSDGYPVPLTDRRYGIIVVKPASSRGVITDRRWLPLLPIWPGFAINTIFYAAILWLPLAPFQLRRYVRVKRGHCIRCGYDLRNDFSIGCPECGWRRLCGIPPAAKG